MGRDSFIFYRSFKEAIDLVKDKKKKLMFYECLTDYIFYQRIPENIDKEILAMFVIIKKQLDNVNSSFWNYEDRRSSKYKKWKKEVLERDNYTCKNCGIKTNLVVHHIEHFAENKEKRFDVENGQTLCNKCHKEVHKDEKR